MSSGPYKYLVRLGVVVALVGMFLGNAAAQSSGSRIQRGSNSTTQTDLWMGPPGEVLQIRTLLQRGEIDEAVELARVLVDRLTTSTFSASTSTTWLESQYDAFNALCVALSSQGNLDEAIEYCTRAIEIRPNRWLAFNSRGAALFMKHDYAAALADFESALENADKNNVKRMLDNNIELVRSRIDN